MSGAADGIASITRRDLPAARCLTGEDHLRCTVAYLNLRVAEFSPQQNLRSSIVTYWADAGASQPSFSLSGLSSILGVVAATSQQSETCRWLAYSAVRSRVRTVPEVREPHWADRPYQSERHIVSRSDRRAEITRYPPQSYVEPDEERRPSRRVAIKASIAACHSVVSCYAAGIFRGDELATAWQRKRLVKRSFPAAMRRPIHATEPVGPR
jgi:hypothetical protein